MTSELRYITEVSYPTFRRMIPRIDQQARVAARVANLLCQDAVASIRDLLFPGELPSGEGRMSYRARMAEERKKTHAQEVEQYILDKGFGTEAARQAIRFRQDTMRHAGAEESISL